MHKSTIHASEVRVTDVSELFKILSDETRLRIVRLFLYSGKELCVCEIVDALNLPQYQVSRHLAALKSAGLTSSTKKGTWAYYHLNSNSPLSAALWTFLATAPVDMEAEKSLQHDRNALDLRLALRENGACVVGLTPAARNEPHNSENSEKQNKKRRDL